MSAADVIGLILVGGGALVMLITAVGVIRFPDFYTRLHAAGTGDTLGQALILAGLLVISLFGSIGDGHVGFKLALITFFVLVLNATATHASARAGWLAGMLPWRLSNKDDAGFEQREGQMSDADRTLIIEPHDEEVG